ncbi:HEAT repeat domain-containing protein [Okeania sp. SIO2B3]|uniref:HEAT repeat domain-containing protein n=1 Tax=Okeania sp. SIO2B3 TaxID=2607784 RepID=UPI0013BFB8ED|nr:HEAT repeat domain-containing protein [Okeania sp. SIO2B3]NET46082.1 HEAT repeat domain-containing protein [Okeania sp. SIO2B3]
MVKSPKQTLLAVLKIALVSTSLPLIVTSLSPLLPGTKQINSLVFAQENVEPNPQPTASLKPKKTSQPTEQKTQENSENSDDEKEWEGWLILIPVLAGLYLGVLWFRPLWLLVLPAELKIPKTPINLKLPPAVQHFLKYRPRVLDAWVEKHLETFQRKFLENETVEERKDYVSLPVELNGEEIDELTAETLSEPFNRERRVRLLIWGEGGSGKTTIACQIAKWAMKKQHQSKALAKHLMLPVLIDKEIDNTGDGIKPIMEAIMAEIQELIDNEQMIVDELLVKQLLRQRRILLIVDRYSEMSQETQEKINPDPKEFPANALIVTSRIEENFRGIDLKIKTLRFDGGKLAYFIEQYLKECGKWGLFEADQEEFLQECAQLARIVGEQKTITVLLAKLYAEKMINSKENNVTSEGSLDNIPDLILNHLEKLNRQGERETKSEYPTIKQDAQLIAWKCLEEDYKPSDVKRKEVIEAFPSLDTDEAEDCLNYFEKDLRLLKRTGYGPIKDRKKIRFALDPVAEYLAALYLVQENKDDEEKWREFVAKAGKKLGKEEIKGFLLAVRDCCLAKGSEVRVPSFVADEIGKLAGLDLDALEKELERQRIKRLVRNLFAPGATVQDRVDDLKKIGGSGSVAKFVALDIVKCLKDDDEEVCRYAVGALTKLGNSSETVVQALLALLQNENPEVRKSAAWALGNLANDSEPVLQGLLSLLQDDDREVRKSAVKALGNLGNTSEPVVQALLALPQDDDREVRKSAVKALGNLGNASEPVVQALLALLQDDDRGVRLPAAEALGDLGNASEALVQALLVLLQDEDSEVRFSAVEVLGNLGNGSEPVVQALLALLQDDDRGVRHSAVEALNNLGDSSEPVVKAILALLKDEDSRVLYSAVKALGNLGNGSEPVVQALLALLQDEDRGVCYSAAEALGNLGNGSEAVVQALLDLLQDKDAVMRHFAAEALSNLGNGSEPVVQALLALLQDENNMVRSSAAKALGNLGNGSEPVVQALLALLQDEDNMVCFSAKKALKKLGINSESEN